MVNDEQWFVGHLLFGLEFDCEQRRFDSCIQSAIEEARCIKVLLTLVDIENLKQVTVILFALFSFFINKLIIETNAGPESLLAIEASSRVKLMVSKFDNKTVVVE